MDPLGAANQDTYAGSRSTSSWVWSVRRFKDMIRWHTLPIQGSLTCIVNKLTANSMLPEGKKEGKKGTTAFSRPRKRDDNKLGRNEEASGDTSDSRTGCTGRGKGVEIVSRCSAIARVHFLSWVAWGRCSSAMRPESGFHRAEYGSKQRVQIAPSGFFGHLCQWDACCDPLFLCLW